MTAPTTEAQALRAASDLPPPILVGERFYLTKCRSCGWVGSSEQCGTDSFGDDSDVYCPVCFDAGCEQEPTKEEAAEHGEAARAALAQPEGETHA